MTQNNEREALIADAEESGFYNHPIHGLVTRHSNGSWVSVAEKLEKFAELQLARVILQNEQQEAAGYVSGLPIKTPQAIRRDANDVFNYPLYTSPPKQIPDGCAIVNVEDLINLAVSYCEDGMHPDDLERDIRAMLNTAPTTSLTSETNTEVGE